MGQILTGLLIGALVALPLNIAYDMGQSNAIDKIVGTCSEVGMIAVDGKLYECKKKEEEK